MVINQKPALPLSLQDSLELHYQDRMNKVISSLERVFSLPMPIVIETSELNVFMHGLFKLGASIDEKAISAEYAEGLFEWYQENDFENFAVPEEVCAELRFSSNRFRMASKKILSSSREKIREYKKANRTASECISHRKMTGRSSEISAQLRKIGVLIKNFEQEYLRRYPLTRFVPPEFNTPLEKYPVNRLHAAINEICQMPDVIKNYSGRYEEEHPTHAVNEGNDAKIFTRALTATYKQPSVLLTCDSDFMRIQRKYRHALRDLMHAYRFNIPQHNLYVAFMKQEDHGVVIQTSDLEIISLDELTIRLKNPGN